MLDIFIYLSPGIFLYLACTCMQLNATLASCSFTCTAGSLLSQGMTHCLLVMEFHRFLPQCRLSVRGLCNVGGDVPPRPRLTATNISGSSCCLSDFWRLLAERWRTYDNSILTRNYPLCYHFYLSGPKTGIKTQRDR